MLGLPLWVAVVCIVVVYAGAVVQASVGVGLGMLSSPVLALADHDFVPAAIVLCVIPLTVSVAWAERAHVSRADLGLTLGGRVPGVIAGASVAAVLSDRVLALLVAGSVLIAVVVSVTSARFDPNRPTLFGAGLASGFMGTATGVGGPPMALAYQHSDPAVMRGTLSAFFSFGSAMSIAALAAAGVIGRRELELAAMLIPGVIVGVVTARLLARHLRASVVRPAALGLSAVSATTLLIETFV